MIKLKLLRLIRRDFLVELKTLSTVVASLLIMIILYIYVVGIAYGNIIGRVKIYGISISYIEFLTPGLMAIAAIESSFIIGSMFWLDRRLGVFSQLLAGPFTRLEYITSKIVTVMLFSLIYSLIIIAFLLTLKYDLRELIGLFKVLSVIPLVSLIFSSLGLIIASYVRFYGSKGGETLKLNSPLYRNQQRITLKYRYLQLLNAQ